MVIWHLVYVSAVNMKTSGRSFHTMTMTMIVMTTMMIAAVSAEVALSMEDPVA